MIPHHRHPLRPLFVSLFVGALLAAAALAPQTPSVSADPNPGNAAPVVTAYTISGNVKADGANLADATVVLSGSQSATTTTDSSGNYSVTADAGASVTVSVYKSGYNFNPTFQTFNNLSANQTANFQNGVPLCAPAPAGLVGWYKAEDNPNDSSGFGNNGSQQNGAGFSNGKVGRNFLLDGVNDYVDLPDVPNNSPTNAVSLQAWIKPHSVGASQTIISNLNASNDNGTYHLVLRDDGSLQFIVYQSTTLYRQAITSPGLISANVYTHVAATFDTATQSIKIYVNGVDKPTTITGFTVTSLFDVATHPRIGAYTITGSFGAPFNGEIDETQIYNRALSATEIQSLYTAGSAGSCTGGAYTAANLIPKIVFQSNRNGNNEIYSMNPDGSSVTNLTNNSASDIEPYLSPDGTRIVFVSNQTGVSTDLWSMNADGSNRTHLTFLSGASDNQPAWSPDGTQIVFTSNRSTGGRGVWRINSDGSNMVELETGASATDVSPNYSPDGSKIAFASNRVGNYEIYTMNADGTGLTRITNNAATDSVPRWSPDGTKILFFSTRDGHAEVYVMNADGTSPTRLTVGTATSDTADWSPDGTQIVFRTNRDGNAEIYTMNADGSAQIRRTTDGSTDDNPCWKNIFLGSNANGKIAFVSSRTGNNDIFTMNADGSNQTNISNNAAIDGEPTWSPDGSKIAFSSVRNGSFDIFAMNADGSNPTRLTTDGNSGDIVPDWSPDGTKIVFSSSRTGGYDIYIMNADGSNQTRLTTSAATDYAPRFSPDGSKIVFRSDRDGNSEIYVMNADGSNQTRLTNIGANDDYPAFSPDGSKIVFHSNRGGNYEIIVMNADGSNQVNLSNNSAFDLYPAWSPDGTKIAFYSERDSANGGIYTMNADGSNPTRLTNNPAADFYPAWQSTSSVSPASNLSVAFSKVTRAGYTVATPIALASAGALPEGYSLTGDSLAYDIRTSALYTPPVTVCFTLSSVNDPNTFAGLKVFHNESGVLVDRTTTSDFSMRTVCSAVTSLSPFIIAQSNLPTSISAISGSGNYGSTATLTATLMANGSPLAGKTINFKLNGTSVGSAITDASGIATLSGVSLSGVDAGSYADAVEASFGGGPGYDPSATTGPLTVAKVNQTITFGPLADKSYGDADFTVSATASSGLPVSFGATGGCTVISNTVHLTGAGSCTVTASQAGDGNYNAALEVSRSFNIAKATPVITWNNPADIVYGTALGGTQLNATASAPGSFTYTPASGTVLGSGSNQNLHVVFTPTDTANYNAAAKDVSINVLSAVLNISMTADRNPAPVGLNFNYKPVVTNTGNAPATNVTLADVLPAQVTFTAVSASQGTCSYNSLTRTVTCNLGTVGTGSSANIQLTVKPRDEGTLDNTASITGGQWDPATGNSSASVNGILATKQVDLAVQKTASANPVYVSQTVTYTMVVRNNSTVIGATGVVLTDSLPASMTFVSATTSQGSLVTPPVGSTGIVTANLGSLAAGATVTVTVTVTASAAGTITNIGQVAANEQDPVTANNTSSATTTVNAGPLQKVLLAKQVLTGGCENTTGNVYLTGSAPAGGLTVNLSTTSLAGVTVPASVFIPAGQTVSPAFTVTTTPVATKQVGLVNATGGASTVSRGLTINVGSGSCPP